MSERRYASGTDVSADKSRAEIERTLQRYGASAFGYGWNADAAVVTFEMNGRRVQFTLPMPSPDLPEFTHHSRGRRTPEQAHKLWEQATRQRWRALALVVKAKLEAVASEITTFEAEFLAHTLVPGPHGRPITVGDLMLPQVEDSYRTGQMPGGLMLELTAGSPEV